MIINRRNGEMERLVGKQFPEFELEAVTGDGAEFIKVKKEDYKGKWLVLFFYPNDFTFVCPTEITAFSDAIEDFKSRGAEVLTCSTDSVYSHQAWIQGDLGKINFPDASDRVGNLSRDLGIYIDEEGCALRGLYIVNPEGVVQYSVVHDLNVGRSVEETLRVLDALQSGGLCPINWHKGEKTL